MPEAEGAIVFVANPDTSTLDLKPSATNSRRVATNRIQAMSNSSSQAHALLLIIIAILLPPLAVFLKTRNAAHTIINLVLTLLLWIPGLGHALYLVLKK